MPASLNTWGASCGTTTCSEFRNGVSLSLANVTVVSSAGPSDGSFDWVGSSSDPSAFAWGQGGSGALVAAPCTSSSITSTMGWVPKGTVTVNLQMTWASLGNGYLELSAGAASASFVGNSATLSVPDGPLTLAITMTSPCGGSRARLLVSDIRVGFVQDATIGGVIRTNYGNCAYY